MADKVKSFADQAAELKQKATAHVAKAVRPGESRMARLVGSAGPHVTSGPVRDSAGYSILKAAAYCAGLLPPEQCKEEVDASNRLKALYLQTGYSPHYGHRAFLVPAGTDYLPTKRSDGSDWAEMKAIKDELRQKMAASLPRQVDHDEVSWLKNKVLGTTSEVAGGSLVAPPALGELIDLQRQFEAFSQAGASNIELPPQGRIQYPKQTSGATAYWVAEATAITESDIGTGELSLEAKKLGVLSRFNNELLRFASPQVEAIARTDMAAQLGLKADRAMFDGTGGTQIKGLYTYTTQTSWTQGSDKVLLHTATTTATDGNTFEPQDVYQMRHKLPDPVQAMSLTWVFNTTHAQGIMSRRADAVTAADQKGPFVFNITRDPNTGLPSGLYGGKLVLSQNSPNNRVKGNGTNLVSVLLGYFGDWIIARSGTLELEANPYETNAFAKYQTLIRGVQFIDAGPRHNASFIYCDTLLPTA